MFYNSLKMVYSIIKKERFSYMSKQLNTRKEVEEKYTWDLSTLFASEEIYLETLDKTYKDVVAFEEKYKGKVNNVSTILEALKDQEPILENLMQLSAYVSLQMTTDRTDLGNVNRQGAFSNKMADMSNMLSFFESELLLNDTKVLEEAVDTSEEYGLYLKDMLRSKPYSLTPEVEKALTQFSQVFGQPYQTYLTTKLADMQFDSFEVDGKEYPMSFVLFENEWEFEADHALRYAAYDNFFGKLKEYQNGLATNFQTEVLKQKAMANLKGFDSVIDYLLFDQKVSREMYDRQMDVIMKDLAPAMRKYARLIKDTYGLEKMTYADLKLPVDVDFEPTITVDESRQYIMEGLAPLGEDYLAMVQEAYDDRWIDFPQNLGKSTGAFCSSPYGAHPFVLISWTKRMREVFVLAHELGHAGHFYLSGKNQNIYNVRPSLYFIEAPSTANELIVAEDLISKADDDRMKRWVYASMVSRTYYHNFVTHLLEGAYQREVYRYVDEGKPLSAAVLNELTLKVIREFWGDEVEVPDYVGLTWMRQPHYFMGLYPYTYSAGLTIATAAVKKIKNGEISYEDWKEVLKAGGTKDPQGLAEMVNVDLTTEQPLKDTIGYISDMVDSIVDLTDKINSK